MAMEPLLKTSLLEVAVDALSIISIIFLVLFFLRLPSQLSFDSRYISTPALKYLVKIVLVAVIHGVSLSSHQCVDASHASSIRQIPPAHSLAKFNTPCMQTDQHATHNSSAMDVRHKTLFTKW